MQPGGFGAAATLETAEQDEAVGRGRDRAKRAAVRSGGGERGGEGAGGGGEASEGERGERVRGRGGGARDLA